MLSFVLFSEKKILYLTLFYYYIELKKNISFLLRGYKNNFRSHTDKIISELVTEMCVF